MPSESFGKKLLTILRRVEDGILVGLLLTMIGMAVAQIFLRNLFGGGIVWGDVLVRVLVLWIGLVGAMIASRNGNHIRIDLVARYLPEGVKHKLKGLTELFTAIICGIVAWHSLRFVHSEIEYGGVAFASVPAWVCESVIPLAFCVIALRYALLSVNSLSK